MTGSSAGGGTGASAGSTSTQAQQAKPKPAPPPDEELLCVEAFEVAGRPSDALQYALADLQDPSSNFVKSSLVRSGRVLGRCHAALGQRELSSAALEAAMQHARTHRLLWSESLVAREMGLQQQESGRGS